MTYPFFQNLAEVGDPFRIVVDDNFDFIILQVYHTCNIDREKFYIVFRELMKIKLSRTAIFTCISLKYPTYHSTMKPLIC